MEATGKVNYKIRVNIACDLYIDDELIQRLDAKKLVKLSLEPGEYLRKVVAVDNPSLQDEKEICIEDKAILDNIELCETPDAVPVDVVPSAPIQEFKKYDIFISYRKDSSFARAEALYNYLHNGKYTGKVFRDVEELTAGDYVDQILDIVDNAKLLAVILDKETFKDRDISNDTSEQYKRWANMSRAELHAEIDSMPDAQRDKINYIRIEILRAKAHGLIIFPILYKDRKDDKDVLFDKGILPEDLKDAIYAGESIYPWSFDTPEKWLVTVKDTWEIKVDKVLLSSIYSKLGKDILPEDIYFDKNRAKAEYGFVEDFYWRRKVDDELEKYVSNSNSKPFLFVQGMPGSGKTRAIYELCKGGLREKDVVILRQDNIIDIAKNISSLNDCYMVCDQIVDVLIKVDEDIQEKFLSAIAESNGKYHLIASNTINRLKDFLDDDRLEDVFGSRESKNYRLLEIKQIDDDEFIEALEKRFGKLDKKGKSVADFIPALKKYSTKIYSEIIKDLNKDLVKYWLKSLQLVSIFRKGDHPLFLAILILEKMMQKKSRELDKDKLVDCIKKMLNANFLYLYHCPDSGNRTSMVASDIDNDRNFISLSNRTSVQYDGEDIINGSVLSDSALPDDKKYVFETNELVWHYLEEKEDNRQLFDFTVQDDVNEAMEIWYETFTGNEISSLQRILPRVPMPTESNVKTLIRSTVATFIKTKLEKITEGLDKSKLNLDIRHVYGLLIGRAQNDKEVNEIIEKIKGTPDFLIHGNIIGEWYRYASEAYKKDEIYKKYVEESIRTSQSFLKVEGDTWLLDLKEGKLLSPNELYNILQEYRALKKCNVIKSGEFDKLLGYLKACFERVSVDGANVLDSFITLNDFERAPINAFCNELAICSNSEIGKLRELYGLLDQYKLIEGGLCTTHQIYRHLADEVNGKLEKCQAVIDVFFKTNETKYLAKNGEVNQKWTLQDASGEMQKTFVHFLMFAINKFNNFTESVALYDIYKQALGDNSAERFKLLTKAFGKSNNEFEKLEKYWNDVKDNVDDDSKKVLVAVLMSQAPTAEKAIELMNTLKDSQIDSYCLRHILNILKANNKQLPDSKNFDKAVDVAKDYRLEKYKKEGQILNLFYQLACDKKQEEIVDKWKAEGATFNNVILNIKMNKEYRTLEEAFELYKNFYDEDLDESQKKRYSDMFSTIVLKCCKLNNPNETEQQIIEQLKKEKNKCFYKKDRDFVLSIIRLGVLPVFDDNGEFTSEFLDHVSLLDNTDTWEKLKNAVNLRGLEKEKVQQYQEKLEVLHKKEYEKRRLPDMRPNDKKKSAAKSLEIDVNKIWNEAKMKQKNGCYNEAIELYKQILGKKKFVATQIGQCYLFKGNINEAIRWNKQGCDEGCNLAPYNLFVIYIKYKEVYNEDQAIHYLKIAKESGNNKTKDPNICLSSIANIQLTDNLKVRINEVIKNTK